MPNCGLCGKFLATKDCVRCGKCTLTFHRQCGQAPTTGPTPTGWSCQSCKNRPAKLCPSPDDTTISADISADMSTSSNQLLIELTREIKCLRNEFNEIRNEISEFKTSLLACCNRVTVLEDRITEIEKKVEKNAQSDTVHLNSTIAELQQRLDDRDQELLLNDLEVSGVPERSNESVIHVAKLIALKLGMQIEDHDIVYAERSGLVRRNRGEEEASGSQRPRNIIIRFARRMLRNDMLRAARIRRGLKSADIDLPGDPRKLYVNERLTQKNRRLFGKTREAAKHHKWKYVWTKNGAIFARKDDGKPIERIRTESDVGKIFSR